MKYTKTNTPCIISLYYVTNVYIALSATNTNFWNAYQENNFGPVGIEPNEQDEI